ncbi:MAG: dTMP kinase [Planctomycetes bacterium]|nr:dTMP kinase [Planctomycetota bacterium]
MNRGRFLVLDGPDGSGKSTQTRMLCEFLSSAGRDPLHLREPGGTSIGEKVRKILLDPENRSMHLKTELLLYMASRAQIVEEVIRPALAAGRIVVCERFLSSSLAYQGFAGGLGTETVATIGTFATGGLVPDRTFLLDIPAAAGLGRIRRKTPNLDRIEDRTLDFHERVRQGFLGLARQEPERYVVLDASGEPDAVQAALREHVHRVLR